MVYIKPERYFSFADLAAEKHADKTHSMMVLKQLNHIIDWKPLDKLLGKFYVTDKLAKGRIVYPPLVLFKCLLLQKLFQIYFNIYLGSQINDRVSFHNLLSTCLLTSLLPITLLLLSSTHPYLKLL